ncbi:chitobiase/beta-hexosaminidase C-terminal domain-containing protein [Phycisphaera mikurensis]|uniref:GH29D-like beta-sandwich domain-containing protein n=1 Tax=Phycisphaera mikurensis (strain NBRC 102666 / KCTC 22515 / FYK2301M01) TaxID=1142394 RepID=I0ICT3_PHYMF|nr:chitobiase/beta-hexosaminidase C-terminal domain-containing protein [Phycisphaera mikurensis]MBB6443309.1 hypothetical protein [Phycisphaera mikurensis]BAM03071.1 hypothetical protein PSMK_09120 [Phycisphaera mikurensis NBRC 102666]
MKNCLPAALAALTLLTMPGLSTGSAETHAELDAALLERYPGGTVHRIDGFDLSSPDAEFNDEQNEDWRMQFVPAEGDQPAHWRMHHAAEGWANGTRWSRNRLPIKPNTPYVLSMKVKTDFDQQWSEVNGGCMTFDGEGTYVSGSKDMALPSKTFGPGGWSRWDQPYTFPAADRLRTMAPHATIYVGETVHRPIEVRLADIAVVELPPARQGIRGDPMSLVTFPGGPGALPMSVERHGSNAASGVHTVDVTGVRWVVDPRAGTLTAHQRIGVPRPLVTFTTDADLGGLTVRRSDDTVLVLGNDAVLLGFQCDGMLAVAPLAGAASFEAKSAFAAPFARLGDGAVFASDGYGGFTAAMYPQRDTGKIARAEPVGPTPDFAGLHWKDTDTLSREPAGWRVGWSGVEPGDRMFLSAFPPRAFPWADSFDQKWLLTWKSWDPARVLEEAAGVADVALLWDFHWREWGMTFSDRFIPFDPAWIDRHVEAADAAGMKSIAYASAWFHRTRDPEVFADAILEAVDRHGFDGTYSDGLPSVDWIRGYETMRLLRAAMPDGHLLIHDSVPQSGRHVATLAPWIYTYASVTYMAEHLDSGEAGPDWAWVRYVLKSHRVANAVGSVKADEWNAAEFDDTTDKHRASLLWNARGSSLDDPENAAYFTEYVPQENALRGLWEERGDEPFFYDRVWLPAARELTGFRHGPAAMPTLTPAAAGSGGTPRWSASTEEPDATLRFTTDGTDPTAGSPVVDGPVDLPAGAELRVVAFAEGLEPSLIATTDPAVPARVLQP